ncbi:hypothetical protein AMQ83_18285 [Paenibacillus riograndensis]|nr:hypothetical protein AMQ83_18285 [Paenibacillus riograndensis]
MTRSTTKQSYERTFANTPASAKAGGTEPVYTVKDSTILSVEKLMSAQRRRKVTVFFFKQKTAYDINSAIARGFQEILLNGADIKQTLDAVEKEVNRIISQGS